MGVFFFLFMFKGRIPELCLSQDENSPYSQLKNFWLSTECMECLLKSGFQALFGDLSVSIQSHWTLLNGRHIKLTIQYFFQEKIQNFSSDKGFKSHIIIDYNAWNKFKKWKTCPRAALNPDIFNLIVPKPTRYLYRTLLHIGWGLK